MNFAEGASLVLMFLGAMVTLIPNMFNIPQIRRRAEEALRNGEPRTNKTESHLGLSSPGSVFVFEREPRLWILGVDIVLVLFFCVVIAILIVATSLEHPDIVYKVIRALRSLLLLIFLTSALAALAASAILWATTKGRLLKVLIWLLDAGHVRTLTWLGAGVMFVGVVLGVY